MHQNLQSSLLILDDENLKCCICLNYIFECVSLLKCFHNYCGACLTKLVEMQTNKCPYCRGIFDYVIRNHKFDELVQFFLQQYPEKQDRSTQDYKFLKQINLFRMKIQTYNEIKFILKNVALGNHQIELKLYRNAIYYYEQALIINQNISLFHSQKALMHILLCQYPEAIISIDKALKIDPHLHEYYNQKAFILIKQLKFQQSLLISNQSLEVEPLNEMACFQISLALIHLDRAQESIQYIQKSISINPENNFYHDLIGYAYFKLQDYHNCIYHYDKAIQLCPQKATYHKFKAEAFFELGEFNESIKCCEEVRNVNENYYIFSGLQRLRELNLFKIKSKITLI